MLNFCESMTPLKYADSFTEDEFARLSVHPCLSMGEHWSGYVKDSTFYLHRMGTGRCIYIVQLTHDVDRWVVTQAHVVDNPSWYKRSPEEDHEIALLRWLIRSLALGQDVAFPHRPGLFVALMRRLTRRFS